MKKYRQIYLFVLLIVFIASCKGQKETNQGEKRTNQVESTFPTLPVEHLADRDPYFIETNAVSTSYGPNSITRNILQDRNGHFWFASWEGIIRYDGKSFTNYTNKEKLRRYHTFSVLEDKKGGLWFGTIGAGVYHYDGKIFTNFTTKEGLAGDEVTSLYEDKSGKIWIGTITGVSCYDGKIFKSFTTKDGLTDNDINSIIEDQTGTFWFGTRGEACFYDGKSFTKFTTKEGKAFTNVRSIIEDKKGNIWLGGNDGLWSYDGATLNKIAPEFVGYIYEDKAGNIWTSAFQKNSHHMALNRYDAKTLSKGETTPTQIKKEDGQVFGIWEDTDGNIWYGRERGVCRYDGKSFNCFIN